MLNTWFIKRKLRKIRASVAGVFINKRRMELTIKFTQMPDGTITTALKASKNIPYSYAITALERVKFDLQQRLTRKAQLAGFTSKDPKTRGFIKEQTLGDLI
jgi:hypothetical protein